MLKCRIESDLMAKISRRKNKNKKKNGKKNKRNKNKKNKNKQNKPQNISKVQNNAEALVNELSRQGKSAIGPSLNFLTSSKASDVSREPLLPQPSNPKIRTSNSRSFDFRTGRQTNGDKVVVPGFANGLPNGTPEGVKIALASANRGEYKAI